MVFAFIHSFPNLPIGTTLETRQSIRPQLLLVHPLFNLRTVRYLS